MNNFEFAKRQIDETNRVLNRAGDAGKALVLNVNFCRSLYEVGWINGNEYVRLIDFILGFTEELER